MNRNTHNFFKSQRGTKAWRAISYNDTSIIKFGKYKNYYVKDLPDDYIKWCHENRVCLFTNDVLIRAGVLKLFRVRE